MDHHTLIVPRTDDEAEKLFDIERRFDANETWPVGPARRNEAQTPRSPRLLEVAASTARAVRESPVTVRRGGQSAARST